MDKNTVVIAIDHGWSNMKTVHETFTSGIREITTEPALFENVLEKDGKYYLHSKQKNYLIDKKSAELLEKNEFKFRQGGK